MVRTLDSLDAMSKGSSDGTSGLDIAGQVLDVLRSGIAAKQTPPRPHTDEEKADAAATLAAYNDLGPDYQEAVVESFLNRLDQQLARRNAALVESNRKANEVAKKTAGVTTGMLAVCLALGIPLTAVALSSGATAFGLMPLIVVWAGIVMVALVLGLFRRR